MKAHPALLRGPVAADATPIRTLSGWVAKGGAEGLFSCSGDRVAITAKVEKGAAGAILPAVAAFLRRLAIDSGDLGFAPLENSRGERFGMVRIRSKSRVPESRSRV